MRTRAARMSGSSVLDFGAGPAPYRSLFSGYERYVTADIPGAPADLTIEDGRVPAPDGAFDAVVSTQVLEHVPDPHAYLSEAHRLLAPGGTLILSTHGIYWYHPAPDDLWRWTSPGLARQIERAGFDIVELVPIVTAPAAALTMFFQYAAELAVHRRARRAWHLLTQSIVRAVDQVARRLGAPAEDAAVFLVTAQRR
jgi:SAM-dependent methyltransferase